LATAPYRYANSPYSTAEAPSPPGFLREATTAWTLGPINQGLISLEGMGLGLATRDPAYNPWSDMKGYEPYAESLIHAQSRQQMDWMKSQVDFNLREKSMQSGGAYGFAANLIGSLADPINLVPIPISRGLGFVKGAALGATANAGIAAVTDPIRIAADPTADWNELAYSIGGAALFGGALGGVAGRSLPFSKQDFLKGQLHFDRLASDLSDIEGTNIARAFDAAEENYNVVSGATGLFEDGRYEPVKIEVVDTTLRQKQGPDGNLYHYDDSLGWVLEADRGRPDPRPVGQDIQDTLGAPERKLENRMVLDEAALKKDFEDGRTSLPDGEFRTSGEYITFKQIEAVWRKREPLQPGETKASYQARVRESALAELKGSRASASVARTNALATLLDKANFSPVAKALRLFKNDNVLGDLPLQLAGDYGWAIRANEFGYKTPPSLLLRAMRHNVAFNEVRQAVDSAYVRFAQQNAKATGTSFMGHNLTAAAEGLKTRAQSLTGQKVVTKEIFARMAGRAVFDQSDFEIDGIKIVPEAREAAKTWARIAQKYDAEARELGIFYDQTSLMKTAKDAETRIIDLRSKLAEWLWNGSETPRSLMPAIKIGDRLFTGKSHDEAISKAINELGADTQITRDMYGYVRNPNWSGNSTAMIGPLDQPTNDLEWMDAAGGSEPAVPKFSVQSKSGMGGWNTFEYRSFADYEAETPEFMKDARIKDEASFLAQRKRDIQSFFDRSLWDVANGLLADGVTLTGQENRNGYNGVTYWNPLTRDELFLSAQAHAFLKLVPPDRLTVVQQTLDRIFPDRADPRHDATLSSELTDQNPDPGVLKMYGLTEEEWRAQKAAGARTQGRMVGNILQDTATGKFYAVSMIRVAVNRFYNEQVLNTAWHEAIHALYRTGRLTEEEWGLLVSEAKKRNWHESFTPGNRLGDEEAVAWGIGHWAANPNDPRVVGPDQPPEVKSLLQRIVQFFNELGQKIGITKPSEQEASEFEKLLGMIDNGEIGRRNARLFDTPEELKASVATMTEASPAGWRNLDELINSRINSLTDSQRRIYDDWQRQLGELERSKLDADAQLKDFVDQPHRFLDQYGNPEPFFARFWNHTAIGDQRDRFKTLLTAWYRRDNPTGAEQRAEKTIDDMLKDGDSQDTRPAQVPGLRHLNQRKLDMPNSFKITDPQLGEISAAEFFNTDLEVVAEAYLRGMGHKIEAAKMFGDANLWSKSHDIEAHWRETVYAKAAAEGASTDELARLRSNFDEYMGWVDIIKRGVMGGLKTRDPWAMDNRIARNLKNYQVLTSMGRVLMTSIPEAMRLPMVNGFKTAFGSLWDRALLDYSKIKPNVELSRETGELFDLVRDVHSARVAELNTPDPSGGGSYIEKLLQKAVPGFFKMVGLTHWTVMTKDMLMFGAQHKVMQLAKAVDEGNNAFKLASMGISRRDAKLLASMPSEQHGNLILPAVQNWAGPDGQRARTLLIDAIHGEARRAIVTPSFADRSLLFNGVAARKGKVVAESDLMSLPLQFMSYGIAASQKVLMSGLQGRDQSFFMGALAMMFLGMFSNYLKQPQTATMNKSTGEWLLEGYEASGVGAFWFSDLNQMIERYSSNSLGIRPALGIDPRFGKTTNVGDFIDAAGPSIGTLYDVGSAFLDPELTPSNRAQAIRRAVPYNNVIWWGSITRDLATKSAQPFK
jgi:hypothetical protein